MSGFFGGDTETMRQQASACTAGAQRLAELIESATSSVDGVSWVGTDAESFRESWHSGPATTAREAAETLRRLAQELQDHAEEQDETSSGDDGGLLGMLRDLFPGPIMIPGPLMPLPAPIPGLPLGPGVNGSLSEALDGWFTGNGGTGPQDFYGDPGYGDRGQMYGQDRPVGDQFTWNPDLLPGREFESDKGYIDVHAGANYSAGMNGSTDEYGNMTGTVGARGSLEAGIDEHVDLGSGFGADASMKVGMESYAEAGGTVGPDGYSVGARAGSGIYAEQSAGITHESGASAAMSQSYFVGAEAHANAYQHVTRNADGQVNGFSSGFDAGAFAGAEVSQKFEATSPGGWFSASGGVTEAAGAGGSASAGYTVSTDEVSFSAGGKIAAELGLGGLGSVSMNPNAIVDSFTPGDYNVDDAISDARGSWDAASSTVGSAAKSLNPFD